MGYWIDLVGASALYEADIIKGMLESAGIPVRLSYETMERLGVPLRASLTGSPAGIRIQVPEDRIKEAQALLTASKQQNNHKRIRYVGKFKAGK